MSEAPKVKLTYLDKRVKGDAVRLALIIGGIPFEDERISYEEIARRRDAKELPFSQVPVMDIGDGHGNYAQSGALLRWAGRQGGLYPDEHMLLCDSVVETIADMWPELIKIGYGSAMMRNPVTSAPMVQLTSRQHQEAMTMCRDVVFPVRFQQLEALLQKSSGTFFCGSQITIADVAVYALVSQIQAGLWAGNGITAEVLGKCPKIVQLAKHIDALHAVQTMRR
jgi:glutathione S-transferase